MCDLSAFSLPHHTKGNHFAVVFITMSVIVLLDWGVEDWMAKLHVKAPRRMTTTCLETALTVNVGCDIDGHGLADIRKMHLAKSLDDAKLLNRQTGIDNSNDESDQGSTESPRAKALDRLEKELEGLEMRVAYFVPRRGVGGTTQAFGSSQASRSSTRL